MWVVQILRVYLYAGFLPGSGRSNLEPRNRSQRLPKTSDIGGDCEFQSAGRLRAARDCERWLAHDFSRRHGHGEIDCPPKALATKLNTIKLFQGSCFAVTLSCHKEENSMTERDTRQVVGQ